ncbi:unnamed protein product, partial [Amoebophrya sp. A120]
IDFPVVLNDFNPLPEIYLFKLIFIFFCKSKFYFWFYFITTMSEAARRMGSEEVAFSSLQKSENGTGHVDLEKGDAMLFRDGCSTTAALLDENNGGKYEQENPDEHEVDHHSCIQRRSGLLITLLACATVIFAAAFAVFLCLYNRVPISVRTDQLPLDAPSE